MSERIFIAVAWPYANGSLHLGHLAGCYLPADIFARYHRMKGSEVLIVSGSDQHGTPITIRAEQEGLEPQQVVDRFHAQFLDNWERMGISFDLFTTTGTDNHRLGSGSSRRRANTQNVFECIRSASFAEGNSLWNGFATQEAVERVPLSLSHPRVPDPVRQIAFRWISWLNSHRKC